MLTRLAAALILLALPARADAPRVVTDIAPVHSLVAMVLEGLGDPDLLLAPGTSAHHFTLKPSQARALAQADLVIWIGPSLTPPLGESIATLAPGTAQLVLAQAPGTHALPYRDLGDIGHDHDADHDGHEDEATDPHLWLAPENALVWLAVIANELAALDPENAAVYRENAGKGAAVIQAAAAGAMDRLTAVKPAKLAVFHDAFQYFEQAFGLTVIGAISDSEAAPAGPARLDALRDYLEAEHPACILTEPGANLKLVQAVAPDVPMVELDPMGTTLPLGTDLYPALLTEIATRLATCAD